MEQECFMQFLFLLYPILAGSGTQWTWSCTVGGIGKREPCYLPCFLFAFKDFTCTLQLTKSFWSKCPATYWTYCYVYCSETTLLFIYNISTSLYQNMWCPIITNTESTFIFYLHSAIAFKQGVLSIRGAYTPVLSTFLLWLPFTNASLSYQP